MEYKPFAWTVRPLKDFTVYELDLNTEQYALVVMDIPAVLQFNGQDIGINIHRANAIVKGGVRFKSATLPEFVRYRGDTTLNARLTVKGEYRIQGEEDNSKFVCIVANEPGAKFYISKNYPLKPGEMIIIDHSELERNLFIVEGVVTSGDRTHEAFKHLKLTKPQDYVFINNSEENAFLVYMYEVTKDEVKALYPEVSPEAMASVQILQE